MVQILHVIIFIGGMITGAILDFSVVEYQKMEAIEKWYDKTTELEKEITEYNNELFYLDEEENEKLLNDEHKMKRDEGLKRFNQK